MILATSSMIGQRSSSRPQSVVIEGLNFASALGIQKAWMSRAELWRQLTQRRSELPIDRQRWNQGDEYKGVAAVEQFQGILYQDTGKARKSHFRDTAGISLKGTPDGLYRHESGDVALLSVKCPLNLHDEVRDYVLAEVQFNAYVYDCVKDITVCEWTTGGYRIWHVEPNPDYVPEVMPLIEEFVRYLERDEEPPRLRKAHVMPACRVTLTHESIKGIK